MVRLCGVQARSGWKAVRSGGRVQPRTREGGGARRIQVIWPGKLAFQGQMTQETLGGAGALAA